MLGTDWEKQRFGFVKNEHSRGSQSSYVALIHGCHLVFLIQPAGL